MTNDVKVIGEPTPIKSVVDSRITFLNQSASQSLQTEAQEMPQSKAKAFALDTIKNPDVRRKAKFRPVGVPGPASVLFKESRIKKLLNQVLEQGRNSKISKDPRRKLVIAILGSNDMTSCEECFTFVKIKDFGRHDTDKCWTYP